MGAQPMPLKIGLTPIQPEPRQRRLRLPPRLQAAPLIQAVRLPGVPDGLDDRHHRVRRAEIDS